MTLAARAGITVAKTQVIHLTGVNAVAVHRFDRNQGRRIHSISAGTAILAATASGDEPNMGYPEAGAGLRRLVKQLSARNAGIHLQMPSEPK